jgi:hypothetical protein
LLFLFVFLIFLNKNLVFQFVSFPFPHIAIDCFSLFFSISGACPSFSAYDDADGGEEKTITKMKLPTLETDDAAACV